MDEITIGDAQISTVIDGAAGASIQSILNRGRAKIKIAGVFDGRRVCGSIIVSSIEKVTTVNATVDFAIAANSIAGVKEEVEIIWR